MKRKKKKKMCHHEIHARYSLQGFDFFPEEGNSWLSWLNLSYFWHLQKTLLHSHFGDFTPELLLLSVRVQLLSLAYCLFFALACACPSDSAPSHLPASDKCDVTPSEDH